MTVLFHQNMRQFGGGVPARNAAYSAAFAVIAGRLAGAGPVVVAGFTEVCNDAAAANAFGVGGLCAALGVEHYANIACGSTALAQGNEYIASGIHAGCVVRQVGRIFLNATGGSIRLILNTPPALPPGQAWRRTIPEHATRDYRGIVYVVVTLPGVGGPTIAVGFLHNLYTLEHQRTLVMGKLPNMMDIMGQNSPVAPVYKYIGGDFNCRVVDPRGTRRIGHIWAYSDGLQVVPASLAHIFPPHVFTPDGTTLHGNRYDYWYSTINPGAPIPIPTAVVDGQTLDTVPAGPGGATPGGPNQMSDHCASLLQI